MGARWTIASLVVSGCLVTNPKYDEVDTETGSATGTGSTGGSTTRTSSGSSSSDSASGSTTTSASASGTSDSGSSTSGGSTTGGGACPPAPVQCEPGLMVWRGMANTPDSALWDGTTFTAPAPTQPVGPWRYAAGAACPTRPEAIVVAVDVDGNINGMMWDGETWSALPLNPLATGVTNTFYREFGVAYERLSGDAILYWTNDTTGDQALTYAMWDGTTWSSEATITAPTNGRPRQIYDSSAPDSDEIIVAANVSGANYALVWDGDAWGNGVVLGSTAGDTDINVTHLGQSGAGLVVYGTSGNVTSAYRTLDGGTWGAEADLPAPPGTPAPRWFMVGAHSATDRVVVGVSTRDGGMGSEIWLSTFDGSTWEQPVTASSSQASNLNYPTVGVAFEQSTGEALAVYTPDDVTDTLQWRVWTVGGGWGSPQASPSLGQNPNSITLGSDPFSDDMMLCAQDAASELGCLHWDGAAFSTPFELSANTMETRNQPWVFLWNWVQ